MATNTIKTRIQLKNDTEAHWNLATNFVPKQGEVIIYSADDTHPFSRLKVGDGNTKVINLPFIDAATINGKEIKIGSTADWSNNLTYIPNKGDIILYTDKSTLRNNTTIAGIKIGDGLAYCVDLPFVGDDIAEDLLNHINDTIRHITAEERNKWNNKLNCEDSVTGETLILNRN